MREVEWNGYWNKRHSLSEQDWMSCPHSKPLMQFLQTQKVSDRKLTLYGVACCRRTWDRFDESMRKHVEAWELFAEGRISRDLLHASCPNVWSDPVDLAWDAASGEEGLAQAILVREVFGNPFRLVAFKPEWRTDTSLALAQQMYDTRDFSLMPILADALQDVGCDNTDILDHCRSEGPHVRGCWVVDAILGKA